MKKQSQFARFGGKYEAPPEGVLWRNTKSDNSGGVAGCLLPRVGRETRDKGAFEKTKPIAGLWLEIRSSKSEIRKKRKGANEKTKPMLK